MKKIFDEHSETALYTLKFQSLNHNVEEFKKFGSCDVLKSSWL